MNTTTIVGWHMIGDFDSKLLLSPVASGLPLNPPFEILLSPQVTVSTA